jgi:hypothetical protein
MRKLLELFTDSSPRVKESPAGKGFIPILVKKDVIDELHTSSPPPDAKALQEIAPLVAEALPEIRTKPKRAAIGNFFRALFRSFIPKKEEIQTGANLDGPALA